MVQNSVEQTTAQDIQSRRTRGRKPKAARDRRIHAITARLTDDELSHIEDDRPADVPRGEWLRRLAVSRRLPTSVPSINREKWAELGRLACELDQYQRAINEERVERPPIDLGSLRAEVESLRSLLLGQVKS